MQLLRVYQDAEDATLPVSPVLRVISGRSRAFTPEEDRLIIREYARRPLTAIAADLGRHWHSVQQRVNILIRDGQLRREQRFYQPRWTPEEDELLAEYWGKMSDTAVARKLGRTVVACTIRAKRHLGLARKDQFYTVRAVACIFGVDDHLVVRWIRADILTGRRSTVGAGGNAKAWRIEDQDIERFMRRYPWRYNRRRIEVGTYWRNLADRIYLAEPWLTVPEAARELGVGVETVRRHLRRSWLTGERVPEAGKHGGWRIARSTLANFQAKRPSVMALNSVADRNRRRGHGLADGPRCTLCGSAGNGSGEAVEVNGQPAWLCAACGSGLDADAAADGAAVVDETIKAADEFVSVEAR